MIFRPTSVRKLPHIMQNMYSNQYKKLTIKKENCEKINKIKLEISYNKIEKKSSDKIKKTRTNIERSNIFIPNLTDRIKTLKPRYNRNIENK